MKPINAIIAGAQKAGTTSLKYYMDEHPLICTHRTIEMGYFIHDDIYSLGYEWAFGHYFNRCNKGECLVLAKSVAVMYEETAIRRLYQHNPEMLVIVVLRNPVDRAYSAYWYALRMGWEDNCNFDEAVWLDPGRHKDAIARRSCSYLERGVYVRHIEKILKFFPRKSLLIIDYEDLRHDPIGICHRIFDSLGVWRITPAVDRKHNVGVLPRSQSLARSWAGLTYLAWAKRIYRSMLPFSLRWRLKQLLIESNRGNKVPPPMNETTRNRLIDYFRPHNEKLGDLLDIDFSKWSI